MINTKFYKNTPVSRVFRLCVVHFWACPGGVVLEEFLGSMQRFLIYVSSGCVCVSRRSQIYPEPIVFRKGTVHSKIMVNQEKANYY